VRVDSALLHRVERLARFFGALHVWEDDGVDADREHIFYALPRGGRVVMKNGQPKHERRPGVLGRMAGAQRLLERLHLVGVVTAHLFHVHEDEVHLPIAGGAHCGLWRTRGREPAEYDLVVRQQIDDAITARRFLREHGGCAEYEDCARDNPSE